MPDVRMPNGTIIKNVPKGITQDQLLSRLSASGYDTKTILQPQKEKAGLTGSFLENAQTLGLGDEAAAYAANPNEKTRRAFLKAGESKYRQVGFGEGDNWEALKQLIGGSAGQLVAPIAAGLAATPVATPLGGLAAASTVSGSQYTIQNLLRQAQEQEAAAGRGEKPQAVSLGKALTAATGQTALDLAGGKIFAPIAKAFPFMKPLLGKAGGKAAEKAGAVMADAAEKGTIKFAKGVASGVGKGVAFEMPQEVAQQWLERWQAGLSLTDEEAQNEYGQAAIGALVLGGGLGGISGAIKSQAKAAPPAEEVTTEETTVEAEPAEGIFKLQQQVTEQLANAAGPELSTRAQNAIKGLGRVVSNDVAAATPESLARSEKYIQEWEDSLASGTEYEPEVAERLLRPVVDETGNPAVDEEGNPVYEGALVEAKRMVAEARKNLQPTEEAAPVEGVAPIEQVSAEEVTNEPIGEPRAPVDEGVGVGVPTDRGPIPAGAAAPEAGGIESGPVGVGEPAAPDVAVSTDEERDTLGPTPEMEIASEAKVKFADRFAQADLADQWAAGALNTETLPQELQSTPIIERLETMQAGQQREFKRNEVDPLVEAAGNLGVDWRDYNYYKWLKHAVERNPEIAKINEQFPEGGSGITTSAALEGLKQIEAEGLLPKYRQLDKRINAINEFNLKEDVKADLLSEDQANDLRKYKDYVPLKGFAADGDIMAQDIDEDAHSTANREEAMRAMQSASPGGSPQEFRRAMGRGSMPFAPVDTLLSDSERRIRRRVLNMARLPVLKQWMKNPAAFEGIFNVYTDANPKRIVVGQDRAGPKYAPANMKDEYYNNRQDYMVVKYKGVPYYIEFNKSEGGQALRRMFENMNPKDMGGAAKAVAEVNNFLKGMVTYKNPLYLIFAAPFRDISAAVVTAMHHQNLKGSPAYKKNLAAKTLKYALPFTGTWGTIAKYVFTGKPMDTKTGKLLQEMIREGGATLYTRFTGLQEQVDMTSQAIKRLQGVENMSAKERGKAIFQAVNQQLDNLADMMDLSARFATYRAATDYGIQPADAARLALDSSLNLTRRGEKARQLDLIFPFFGASVEAARKTLRISTGRGAAKILGALVAYGVIESMINAAISGDDNDDGQDNYLDQNATMRMSRVIMYYGPGGNDYVKIPIDPMIGYFKFVGNRIGDIMLGNALPGDVTGELFAGAASLLSPLRVPQADAQSALVAFTPLVGKPLAENLLNRNFFGGPIYKESQFESAPASELGRDTTGEGWKWLARAVNSATGGSAAVSSKWGLDFQPEAYRHMVEGWLGGPYQIAKQLAGLKDAEEAADIPGIKSFLGSGAEYAPQNQYYENSSNIRQIMNRLKKLTPEQQAEQGAKFYMDTDPRVIDAYTTVDKALDKVSKEQREVMEYMRKSGEYSKEDEKAVLDHYLAKKNELYSAFNYVYNGVKKGE